MNTIRYLSLMGLLMLALAGVSPATALACTAPPGGLPHFSVADHVKAADIVVEGVVVAARDVNYLQVADIQVAQYIKGSGPDLITVDGYGPSSVCLSEAFVGQHGLFYITTDSAGLHHALYLSQFDAIEPVDSPSVAEAIAAAGQEPVPLASADAIRFRLTEIASTPSATPMPLSPPLVYPPESGPALTQAYATIYAAATAYPNDPATQSAHMTAAYATVDSLQATAAPFVPTPLPFPTPFLTPTPPPTATEIVGLIGIGAVGGLIIGALVGIVIGLFIGRWRE